MAEHENALRQLQYIERELDARTEEQLLGGLKHHLARLRDDPRSLPDRLLVATVQKKLGRLQEAMVHYEGVLRGYAAQGQLAPAIALCHHLLHGYPNLPRIQQALATLQARAAQGAAQPSPTEDPEEKPTEMYDKVQRGAAPPAPPTPVSEPPPAPPPRPPRSPARQHAVEPEATVTYDAANFRLPDEARGEFTPGSTKTYEAANFAPPAQASPTREHNPLRNSATKVVTDEMAPVAEPAADEPPVLPEHPAEWDDPGPMAPTVVTDEHGAPPPIAPLASPLLLTTPKRKTPPPAPAAEEPADDDSPVLLLTKKKRH